MSGASVEVALLGPSGIGRFHAREVEAAGGRVTAVLASSAASSRSASRDLEERFGHEVRPCASLQEIADVGADAAIVATPPELHLEAVDAFLERHAYVLCEKPLFWREGLTADAAAETCTDLTERAAGRLVVNTNNVHLIRSWFDQVGRPASVGELEVVLHTNGRYRGPGIGVDLLPHALSLLMEAVPPGEVRDLRVSADTNHLRCSFVHGETSCRFDLGSGDDLERRFTFRIDGALVARRQVVDDGGFHVFLDSDALPGGTLEVEDPFRASVGDFVRGVARRASFADDFRATCRAMPLLAELVSGAEGR